jgi:prevent-host-death family protein
MQAAPQVETVSSLQRNAPAILRRAAKEPVFLSQHGVLTAVVASVDEWNRIANELAKLKQELRMVEYERQFAKIRAGNYITLEELKETWAAEDASPSKA